MCLVQADAACAPCDVPGINALPSMTIVIVTHQLNVMLTSMSMSKLRCQDMEREHAAHDLQARASR